MACEITKGVSYENSGVILLARLVSKSGAYILQSDISSITCKVFDTAAPSTVVSTPSVTVSTSIFDTLQTGAIWNDTTGYNFRFELPAASLPDGNKVYQVEFKVTPASAEAFYFVYQIQTIAVLSE